MTKVLNNVRIFPWAAALLIVLGCNNNKPPNGKTSRDDCARCASTISDVTGWQHFDVLIRDSADGRSIIITALPGRPEEFLSFNIRQDGTVEILDVP